MKDSFIYVGTAAIVAGTIICIACASNMIHSEPKASENVQLAEEPVAELEPPSAEVATEATTEAVTEAEAATEAETETAPVSDNASATESDPEAVVVEASTEAVSESSEAEDPSDISEPEITMSQKQALGKAKDYLQFGAFSYKGLIHQLEYEKYDNADATFAADNCGADWNEQAAKKAKQYLDVTHFSLDDLAHQLEYEGFTEEQALYGANEAYKEE